MLGNKKFRETESKEKETHIKVYSSCMVSLHTQNGERKYNERLLFAHYIVCGMSFYSCLCRNIMYYILCV
jgi:hypothetical protein